MLTSHSSNWGDNNFDITNRKILDKERNLGKILILEMIEILNKKNSINKKPDMDCFSIIIFIKKTLEKNNIS